MDVVRNDFHTVCVNYWGVDYDITVRCIECTDISVDKISRYLAHKVSLKSKIKSRQKQKALSQSVNTDVAPATAAVELSPATAEVTVAPVIAPPVAVTTVSALTGSSTKEVISHVDFLFSSLAQSLEARFSAFTDRFSQAIVTSASIDVNSRDVSCQNASNPSSSAPSALVAVGDEHPPARAPSVPYSEGLGMSRKGPTTVSLLTGVTSLTRFLFVNVIDRVRVCESSMDYVPDSYLTSLRSFFVYSDEFNVAIGGDSLADSIRSYRQLLTDLVDPITGSSQGGDNVVQFLYRLVALSDSSSWLSFAISGDHCWWWWWWWGVFATLRVLSFPSASLPPPVTTSASLPSFPSASLPPPVTTSASLPSFPLPASSFLPPSVPFSHSLGSFPSFPVPSPALTPPSHARPLLCASLMLRPPCAGPPPLTPPPFSFSTALILPTASAQVSLPSFTSPFALLSTSSAAPSLYLLLFVSLASSSSFSTAVSWSLPSVATCSAPSLASLSAPAPSVSFPPAPPSSIQKSTTKLPSLSENSHVPPYSGI